MSINVHLASVLLLSACGNDPGTVSTSSPSSPPLSGELFPASTREPNELPFTLAANEYLWRLSYSHSPLPGDIS